MLHCGSCQGESDISPELHYPNAFAFVSRTVNQQNTYNAINLCTTQPGMVSLARDPATRYATGQTYPDDHAPIPEFSA